MSIIAAHQVGPLHQSQTFTPCPTFSQTLMIAHDCDDANVLDVMYYSYYHSLGLGFKAGLSSKYFCLNNSGQY